MRLVPLPLVVMWATGGYIGPSILLPKTASFPSNVASVLLNQCQNSLQQECFAIRYRDHEALDLLFLLVLRVRGIIFWTDSSCSRLPAPQSFGSGTGAGASPEAHHFLSQKKGIIRDFY